MIKYVVFLRGINVGGHKLIKMTELQQQFVAMGFKTAKTFIASGNVVIESKSADADKLRNKIEKELEKALGYRAEIFLRAQQELEKIIAFQPFRKIKNPKAKLYATFLLNKSEQKIKLPYKDEAKLYEVVFATDKEIFSVSYPLPQRNYEGALPFIEKNFGKPTTTRNWNTVEKIWKLMQNV